MWNSRRKERSYSPRQRSSILSLVTWCRVVVTASALTRSSRLSLCLGESRLRSAPHPRPAQTPRGSPQRHTAPRASRERYREDAAWQGTARPPQLAPLPGLGHRASLCGSMCGSQGPKPRLLEAALKRCCTPLHPGHVRSDAMLPPFNANPGLQWQRDAGEDRRQRFCVTVIWTEGGSRPQRSAQGPRGPVLAASLFPGLICPRRGCSGRPDPAGNSTAP